MAERSVCRPWTEHEDALLREGVAIFGDQDRWKDVALRVPNRTNKACRKRWLHSLSPTVKKCAWSQDEDRLLVSLYQEHGSKWSLIARSIPGRTDDACSKRYRESLDPDLRKEAWTPEEDKTLLEAFGRIGNRWSIVGQELGRGGLDCRNRWRLLERKRASGRACPYGSPRQTRSPKKPVSALEPSQSQDSASSGELAPLTPSSLQISIQEPQDGFWGHQYPAELYSVGAEGSSQASLFTGRDFEAPSFSISHAALFQTTSSSLSAAFSAPPRTMPLPPDTSGQFSHNMPLYQSHSQPTSQATSPLFSSNTEFNSFYDVTMSLADSNMDNMDHHWDTALPDMDFSQSFNGQQQSQPLQQPLGIPALSFPDDSLFQGNVSPISPEVVSLPQTDNMFFGEPQWKSPHLSSLFSATSHYSGTPQYSPSSLSYALSSTASEPLPLPELSSAASTPFPVSASISPASPNSEIQGDLPVGSTITDYNGAGVSPSGGGSLLFSSPDAQAPAKKRRRTAVRPRPDAAASRLSSVLKLSEDPTVRPYACGHDNCWPANAETSRSCFQTSKDLCDHHREAHDPNESCDKLFRCGLQGCGKSWKSVNGLQYHLQISMAHFKNALQRRYEDDNALQQISTPSGSTDVTEGDDSDRRYPCTHPNCFKAYRQPSGLRYHIRHGHPTQLPTQIEDVPPALERELPKKARKMRFRRGTDDFSPSPAHPGAMAAAAGLAAAASSFTPALAAVAPLPGVSTIMHG